MAFAENLHTFALRNGTSNCMPNLIITVLVFVLLMFLTLIVVTGDRINHSATNLDWCGDYRTGNRNCGACHNADGSRDTTAK